MELSAGPFSDLDKARETFDKVERLVEEILTPVGERMLTEG
ncbi:hypothetical protein [Paraeggerthella sp.]